MSALARPAGRVLVVAGIVLMAATLRIAVASLSPVVEYIDRDIDLPAALVGLIGTAPPAAFAVMGMLTPAVERRVGLERLALFAVAVAAAGLAARAVVGDAWSLFAVTAVLFAAVGVGNVLLPGIVKKHFPGSVGAMTAVYTTAMTVATFVPPLVAVPLADTLGWRSTFAVWAAVGAASVIPWLAIARRAPISPRDGIETPRVDVVRRLVRLPLAWALAVTFAVNATVVYTAFAWLPAILADVAGASPAQAGAYLSLFALVGLPCSLFVPLLVARYRVIGVLYAVAVGGGLVAVGGLLFAPTAATAVWVVLLGLPPLLFPMMLVLLGLRTRVHETAVAASGFVQSGGYALAALVPVVVGISHEITGGWTIALVLLGIVIAAGAPAAIFVVRSGTLEDEWERRHSRW